MLAKVKWRIEVTGMSLYFLYQFYGTMKYDDE